MATKSYVVSGEQPVFTGHFPGNPILPGVLLLAFARKALTETYDKLHLWIQEKNFIPYQAEFFAATGKLLKTARYTRYEKLPDLGGKEQLVTIEIQNPLSAGKKTIMEYSQFKVTELPVSRFTVSALSRLR